MSSDQAPYVGQPGHAPDERAHDVVIDIVNGRTTQPARQQIREALDRAEAPLTGRAKSDHGLGRAIR
jgi:hypothetical protein